MQPQQTPSHWGICSLASSVHAQLRQQHHRTGGAHGVVCKLKCIQLGVENMDSSIFPSPDTIHVGLLQIRRTTPVCATRTLLWVSIRVRVFQHGISAAGWWANSHNTCCRRIRSFPIPRDSDSHQERPISALARGCHDESCPCEVNGHMLSPEDIKLLDTTDSLQHLKKKKEFQVLPPRTKY